MQWANCNHSVRRTASFLAFIFLATFWFLPSSAHAQTTGSISGTVADPNGGVLPNVPVMIHNVDTAVEQSVNTNTEGFYAFAAVPVGHYEIDVFLDKFRPYKRTGLVVDVASKLQINVELQMGEQSAEITVTENAVQVETQSSQLGNVVDNTAIEAVPLNGRSFTDLLELEPGVVPMSTQTPDSVVMAGVTVAITPSGDLNPGNQSINGQREDSNGFLVNGSDVKEEMNGGTAIIPNLDSLAEFRVLTNNFDPEYGNYGGGIVNAITKSGTNAVHGSAFEFLRNTDLDAKGFFDLHRDAYQQNQFGGTIGGPIKKNKVFYFGDYQGTRTVEGEDSGLVTVPSLADRTGDFADTAIPATSSTPFIPAFNSLVNGVVTPELVQGAGLATQLQNSLEYSVYSGEPYYQPGCTKATCVFPNATIPQTAWTVPSQNLFQYVPKPNVGTNEFVGQADERLRDDKFSGRVDANTRFGDLSGYYFFDDYYVDNPFPSSQGGASIPGFDGINHGRAQMVSLSDEKTFGTRTVNELHIHYMRAENVVGQPHGGLGVSLASQGFNTNPVQGGILPLAPQYEGVENTVFQGSFVMGVPITNVQQANNTYSVSESLSRVIGSHTIKVGFEGSLEQVNMNPNAIFDGTFIFDGYQTGNEFADFLIGAPNQFNQQDSQSYYPRHKYAGWYGQDSWRIKPNLTLNYGMRIDLMQYWSEKFDQVPTFEPGVQSVVYPNAFPGLVYPTDPGIAPGAPSVPNTLVPEKFRLAPRIGLVYSPNARGGLLGEIFGNGSTSIRASYAILNTMIEGNSIGVDEPQPPYGLSGTVYNGLYVAPYNLADGTMSASPYPIVFPPLNANSGNPNPGPVFNNLYNPQSGMTAPVPWDTYPYVEDFFLSIERQLAKQTVLRFTYVGSEAHHLPLVYSADPGNPGLCLALDQPGVLTAGESCGPGGENTNYNLAEPVTFEGITYPAGSVLQGTRLGLNPSLINNNVQAGNYYGNDDYQGTIGNSNYNALQVTARSATKRLTYTLSYTYSKSIDQASSLSDAVDPFNFNAMRGLSAWNMKHSFVGTYSLQLPLDLLTHRAKYALQGWQISGITRVSTGFPVTLSESGDNSLQGSSPNGVNNRYLDVPDVTGQPLDLDSKNPKSNGLLYFNPAAFTDNALGTVGDAGRRSFSGPGEFNTDLTLQRTFQIHEKQALDFRWEVFNVFNRTNFFGPASVEGNVDNPLFGHVINAQPPRLIQLALKYSF
jgi:hypothetical protein